MDPLRIIEKYYTPGSLAHEVLSLHSAAVMEKSIEIAERVARLKPDLQFVREAAMLHDIGIFMADQPEIGCFGDMRYICHGYLGRGLLESEGLYRHALVCERHVGVGITVSDIRKAKLPIPMRDMVPVSLEEKIICLADKFFSKKKGLLQTEKGIGEAKESISRYGPEKLRTFEEMLRFFNM